MTQWMKWAGSRVVTGFLAVVLTVPMGVPAAFAFAASKTSELRPAGTRSSDAELRDIGRELGVPAVDELRVAVLGALQGQGLSRQEQFDAVHKTIASLSPALARELETLRPLIDESNPDTVRAAIAARPVAEGEQKVLALAFFREGEGAGPGVAIAKEIDELTGAYVHVNRFSSASGLLARLLPYVDFTVDEHGQTRLTIREGMKEALRPLFADLAYDAVVQTDTNVRDSARWVIRELAPQFGVRSASAHDYYQAMGRREINGRTWPAINIRWDGFNMARDIFRAAKKTNSSAFLLEIAASEEGYTGKGHDYGGMAAESLAAAISEGYEGPVYLKMDHTQIAAKDYWKNPAAEVAKLKGKITRGLEAGFMNVDLDSSTIELEPKYVELEVTEWLRGGLLSGQLNGIFTTEEERLEILAALTIPESKENEVRFNPQMVDRALTRILTTQPGLLMSAKIGWKAGELEASLLNLNSQSAREALQYQWDRAQQAESAKVYIELAEHTRKEAQRIYGTPDIGLGAEVGEVGKKFNTTLSQVRAFLDLVLEGLRPQGIEGPNVFSVQSGAAHGGQFDAQGNMIRDVSVDWNLLKAVSELVRTEQYGYIAGSEQHGFSTVAEAKLSELPVHDAAEVHLATEYANILLYGVLFGDPFMAGHKVYVPEGTVVTDDIKWKLVKGAIGNDPADEAVRQQLFDSIQVIEVEPAKPALQEAVLVALQPLVADAGLLEKEAPLTMDVLRDLRKKGGKFKDIVKKVAHNQDILQLFANLPPKAASALSDARETKFVVTFERTNTKDSRELAVQHAKYADNPAPVHPPLALAKALTAKRITLALDEPPSTVSPELDLARKATDSTATLMVAEGIRSSVDPSDKDGIKKQGKKGDVRGKEIFQAVFADAGVRVLVKGAEGVGRDALSLEETFDANEVINPRALGPALSAYIDVIENTKLLPSKAADNWHKLAPATSGTTSMVVLTHGSGIGNVSDNAYGGLFVAVVDPSKVAEYDTDPLNPHVETREDIEPQLLRIARDAKGGSKSLSQMTIHIFNRPREAKRLAALRAIAADNPGMEIIWDYPDGTVRHAVMGTAGEKGGERIHAALMSAGPDEAAGNLGIAKALSQSHGAVGSLIFYSRNLPSTPKGGEAEQGEAKDLSNGLGFDEEDRKEWQRIRPNDYTKIVDDHKIFTIKDWDGDVFAALPAITNDRVFNLPGTTDLGNGRYRTVTVYVQQTDNEPGRIWADVSDDSLAETQRIVARGTFALQEPAAADPAVVDQEGMLLSLMKDTANPQVIAVAASVADETPGFFIAWQRALERFRQDQKLKTLEEAAKASAVKLVVDAIPDVAQPQADGTFHIQVKLGVGPTAVDDEITTQGVTIALAFLQSDYHDVSVSGIRIFSGIQIFAQNVFATTRETTVGKEKTKVAPGSPLVGAFTGQDSYFEIARAGAIGSILAHSEVRERFGVTDLDARHAFIGMRTAGLEPIVAIGEQKADRYDEDGTEHRDRAVAFVVKQVETIFSGVDPSLVRGAIVAYEPRWAIGTGISANADQVREVHDAIRQALSRLFSDEIARSVSLLYGGSASPTNTSELFALENVDGFLVGTAAANPAELAQMGRLMLEAPADVVAKKQGRKPILAGNLKDLQRDTSTDVPAQYVQALTEAGVDPSQLRVILAPPNARITTFVEGIRAGSRMAVKPGVFDFVGRDEARVKAAVGAFLSVPAVAARFRLGLEQAGSAAELAKSINTSSNGATQLTAGLFSADTVATGAPVAIAVGPQEWLNRFPRATAKVAVDPATKPDSVREAASALHAGAEVVTAVAKKRNPRKDVLTRLNTTLTDAGVVVANETPIEKDAQAAVTAYQEKQQTVRGTRKGA